MTVSADIASTSFEIEVPPSALAILFEGSAIRSGTTCVVSEHVTITLQSAPQEGQIYAALFPILVQFATTVAASVIADQFSQWLSAQLSKKEIKRIRINGVVVGIRAEDILRALAFINTQDNPRKDK